MPSERLEFAKIADTIGDTAIAIYTLARCAGADAETAAELSNEASGIVVGKFGTAPVEKQELLEAVEVGVAKTVREIVDAIERHAPAHRRIDRLEARLILGDVGGERHAETVARLGGAVPKGVEVLRRDRVAMLGATVLGQQSLVRREVDAAGGAIDDGQLARPRARNQTRHARDRGDLQRAGEDRSMGGGPTVLRDDGCHLVHLEASEETREHLIDDHHGSGLHLHDVVANAQQLLHHAAADVLHVRAPLAEVGILDRREHAGVLGHDLSDRLEGIAAAARLLLEAPHEALVLQDLDVRVEDGGEVGAEAIAHVVAHVVDLVLDLLFAQVFPCSTAGVAALDSVDGQHIALVVAPRAALLQVAQEFVEACLGARLFVYYLDDDRTIKAVLAVVGRQITGNHDRTGRDLAITYLTAFAVV